MAKEDELLTHFAVSPQYFILDNFMSDSHLEGSVTQTGSTSIRMCDTILDTGVQGNSTARLNYIYPLFNPLYSTLYLRARLSSLNDVFGYMGFMETLEDPTFTMTQSHAGVFFYKAVGVVQAYWSTGNGATLSPTYKTTVIPNLDFSRDMIYELKGPGMRWFPLPLIQPYFARQIVKQELRKWSAPYVNSSCIPKDQAHYFVWFIKNTTNVTKQMYVVSFNYTEDMRD